MRLKVIRSIYFIVILLIVLRLSYWQIIKADELTAMGESQRVSSQVVVSERGKILFSDKSVLASVQPVYTLFAQPKVISQGKGPNITSINSYKKEIAQKLSAIFFETDPISRGENIEIASQSSELDRQKEMEKVKKDRLQALEDDIYNRLTKDLYWVSLGKKVNVDLKQRIEKLNLTGVGFEQDRGRFYPEGSSSAQLLGFVGSNVYGGETGYFGLEGFYDGELRGKKGILTQEKDASGLPILIGKFIDKEPKPGKTLVLNLDRTVQHFVERELKKGMEKYGAKGASAVVMDPKTGNILAMASYPNYDPLKPENFPRDYYRNPVTADGYEPGSTFKVLVMAAGINEGLVKADTVCDVCSGPLSISGFVIRTWNNQYRTNITMFDTIVHSDNTGMVFVAKKLGEEKLYSYIKKFGFGEPTSVDLQDEQSPELRDLKDWKEIDLATASFGQGISVTALQIVRAVSVIANGGSLMEPHVVFEIIEGSKSYKIPPRVIDTPISKDSAQVVASMMVDAVDKGEAQYYKKLEGVGKYKIAGKTGTAQIPVAGHYDATKTIASFVGFAPADDPKFVLLVRYTEPSSSIFGADTAAPTFFRIARELFTYYGIAPTE